MKPYKVFFFFKMTVQYHPNKTCLIGALTTLDCYFMSTFILPDIQAHIWDIFMVERLAHKD